jgi:hypothetical protein
MAEVSMHAILNNTNLPLEFWDKAVIGDKYLKNRTNTGLIINGKITSLEGA